MNKVTRTAVLMALVFIITALLSTAAIAKPPEWSKKPPDGGSTVYVYADDPGWSKSGTWMVEDYSPDPGGDKLLVANDAGATATYTTTSKAKFIEVYAATYWLCGDVEVYVDGALVATVDLNSETTSFGVLIYSGKFSGDPNLPHTVEIRALGTGGPGADTPFGDLSWLHFVNVQYLKLW